MSKNEELVHFPVESLDMRDHAITLKDAPDPIMYDLYGVVHHFGNLNFGHYTATCKRTLDGKWYNFNDSTVTEADPNKLIDKSAYMLWYRRRE